MLGCDNYKFNAQTPVRQPIIGKQALFAARRRIGRRSDHLAMRQ
jgi:hypothetical protein